MAEVGGQDWHTDCVEGEKGMSAQGRARSCGRGAFTGRDGLRGHGSEHGRGRSRKTTGRLGRTFSQNTDSHTGEKKKLPATHLPA